MESSPSDRRPCILHVLPTLGSGGAERQLLTYLSNPTMRDRFRHIVAVTDVANVDPGDRRNHFAAAFEGLGIEIVCLNRPGSSRVPGCIRAIRRVIRERGVDLVHTQLLWANVAGRIAARLCGVPVITSFQNTDYDPVKPVLTPAVRHKMPLIRWLDGLTSRHCLTHSVAVSETVSQHIQHHLGLKPESITVVYNTFAFEQVVPRCADPRGKVFEVLGLSKDDRLVLAVGRLLNQKSHVELVKAMAEVVRQRPEAHLAIVGSQVDAAYVAMVRRTIAELGIGANVQLLEPRHDIPDFLAAADVFGFPSKHEGLPLALAEAMAAGLPCVVSDIGPNRELVRDGVNGLVVPVDDIQALAGAILRILDDRDLAKRMGEQAKIYAYENFHPDRMAESMVRLYEDILNGRSS